MSSKTPQWLIVVCKYLLKRLWNIPELKSPWSQSRVFRGMPWRQGNTIKSLCPSVPLWMVGGIYLLTQPLIQISQEEWVTWSSRLRTSVTNQEDHEMSKLELGSTFCSLVASKQRENLLLLHSLSFREIN